MISKSRYPVSRCFMKIVFCSLLLSICVSSYAGRAEISASTSSGSKTESRVVSVPAGQLVTVTLTTDCYQGSFCIAVADGPTDVMLLDYNGIGYQTETHTIISDGSVELYVEIRASYLGSAHARSSISW